MLAPDASHRSIVLPPAIKCLEGEVTLYGKTYRAVVVHSSSQDQRRQQRLARELQASADDAGRRSCARRPGRSISVTRMPRPLRRRLRASQSPYHHVEVRVEERPKYGRGRPSQHTPRAVKALRYGLQVHPARTRGGHRPQGQEAGCFVLLTNVPTEGEMAHRAGDVLRAYKEQHGIEQNFGFLKDPLIVNSLFLKKPERIEALGLVLLLALLLWRLVERSLRVHVETTGTPVTGWDKKTTERPTAFMMMTKFSGLMVVKVDQQRHLARALSSVQQQYLTALSVQATCFTTPTRG